LKNWFWMIVGAIGGFLAASWLKGREIVSSQEKKAVRFFYHDPNAKSVAVVGDFNGWDETKDQMFNMGGGLWEAVIYLEPGEYEYKFVIDGEKWIEDPNAKKFIDDGKGRRSIVTVE